MEALLEAGIDYAIYFYNPNIHPQKEYLLRKDENIRFADKHGIAFVDADYDPKRWFAAAKGMEGEPERGVRCDMCFSMRFAHTAAYAVQHGYTLFSSALGISRWKDMAQINRAGEAAAKAQPNLAYWTFNWRKGGGAQRMLEVSKRERFYQQEYCGCAYSLRDTNHARKAQGRDIVRIGQKYYG